MTDGAGEKPRGDGDELGRAPRTLHDSFFKAVFGDPRLAVDELRAVLPPEVSEHIDWDTLVPTPANFVDQVFEQRLGDLVFRAGLLDGGEVFLWFLLEHQRKEDWWMVLRVLTTAVKMWQRWCRQHPGARHAPMIIPVVVYHGDRPWRAPRDMLDLYALRPGMWAGLGAHLISCRLVLDDLCATADEDLRARRMDVYAKLCLFAMARGAAEDFLDRLVGDWHAELRAILAAESRDRAVLFLRYTLHVNPHADPETLRERLSPVAGEDAEEAIMSAAEKLIQEGVEQGIEKGQRELLQQLLERRFGALPAAVAARVSAADAAELKRWVDRILDARTLDEVFTEG